jgi:hypothetical protein
MLQSIKQLYGIRLGASDGDIGHVKDFYFDDHKWAVRYVVADTGKWLPGRQVLLSPLAFETSQPAGKALAIKLTRKQVEDSPATDTLKTVSRQYEEEYHRFYGWPCYWEGDGLWGGMGGFPILELRPHFSPANPEPALPQAKSADSDLRSTMAVSGYHIQATDGIVGHVCDFLMDGKSWAVSHLVVKTGHRFTGKEVQLPVSQVDRISYTESTVYVKLTKDAVEKSPEHRLIPNETTAPVEPILIYET